MLPHPGRPGPFSTTSNRPPATLRPRRLPGSRRCIAIWRIAVAAERVNILGRACALSSPTPCSRETPPPSPRSLPSLPQLQSRPPGSSPCEPTCTPPPLQTMLPKPHAILHGGRNQALADDPALYYQDTAELWLLLEKLAAQ